MEHQIMLPEKEMSVSLRKCDEAAYKAVIRYWIWILDIRTNFTDIDKAALKEYLKMHYGYFTPARLKKAIELAVAGAFICNLDHYNALSPRFVAPILNAYMAYERALPKKLMPVKELPRFTAEGEREFLIEGMLEKFERFKTNKEIILNSDHVRLLNTMGIKLLSYTGKTWQWYLDESKRLQKVELENKLEKNPAMFRLIRKEIAEIEPGKAFARRLLLAEFFQKLIDEGKELRDLIN